MVAIFDFDYTLADSSAGAIDCIQFAQRVMNLSLSSPAAIRRTIGLSVPDTLARLNGECERRRSEEFAALFLQRADEVMADRTFLYDAVPGVLAALGELGIARAIATTKYRYRIEQILAREELLDAVQLIVGAEDVRRHKPDPACLLRVLEALRCGADQAIYVGDSVPDAEAAQRAGVDFVLVETGPTARGEFDAYPRLARMESIAHLPAWLAQSTERR